MLWERTAPDGLQTADWSWADSRLERLRELGIRPIVGLVHHGSGPRMTSLVDPEFPEKLAVFAGAVAERYPWVEDWTPVNEPLTTARFSCLYGFWYPHHLNAQAFAQAILIQCRGVVEAMRAIRATIPVARLVQTDDLGKTHSTDPMRYQAEHENERRWLTWDLLSGRRSGIDRWLQRVGMPEEELRWFEDNPCPPDVVGINHYLSSERFLDHRLDRYPEHLHGSNGEDAYVDELAARILGRGPDGPARLLREAWERYHLPIAVTEVHNGSTREEQLRWVREVWEAGLDARGHGADVRALTLWSLLGAVGWDKLVAVGKGTYESGAFDIRAPEPRPTAIARIATALASEGRFDELLAGLPGWWRRPDRLRYPAEGACTDADPAAPGVPPLLVTGKTGTLGAAFARVCELRSIPYRLLSRAELDIAEPAIVDHVLAELRPWAVVNTAGYVRIDGAELEGARCRRENATGPAVLAEACSSRGLPLLTFSSDLVFGGGQAVPYVESDPVAPINAYGRSKAEGEELVARLHPEALVIRTSAFFGPRDAYNFVTLALERLAAERPVRAADDLWITPTYVPHLAHASLDLLLDGERGLWHLANAGPVTWAELAQKAAGFAGLDEGLVQPCPAASLGLIAPRPRYSALASERGWIIPPLEEALTEYLAAVEPGQQLLRVPA